MDLAMPGISLERSIALPWGLGAERPEDLFRVCQRIRQAGACIVLDASGLHFIDPLGLAMLRALLEQEAANKRVIIHFLSTDLSSYLARMNFFEGLDVEGVDLSQVGVRREQRSSLVELTKVTEHVQAEAVASRLAVALTGELTESDPDAPAEEATGRNEFDSYRGPIEYALKELLENSLTHARREGRSRASVWVACQFYRRRDLVRMAIVDNGCGFLATLRFHPELADKTHRGAIEAALRPRVSCNRGGMAAVFGSENQGIGLTITSKIAESAGGSVLVASGDALHDTTSKRSAVMGAVVWDGVSISFSCRRARLPDINVAGLLPEDPADSSDDEDADLIQFR